MSYTIGMEARKFIPFDFEEINNWYYKRNLPSIPQHLLPPTGFIVPQIAAAFLYKTDSALAIIEGCISNPESFQEDRALALDLLLEQLVIEAKKEGFKMLMVSANKQSIIETCQEWEFKEVETFRTFVKEL